MLCSGSHWPFAFGEKKLEKPEGTPQPLRLPDGSPNPIWSIKMEYTKTWASMVHTQCTPPTTLSHNATRIAAASCSIAATRANL